MKKRILIVEDDMVTTKLIQKYILDLGYVLAGAFPSGEEVIEKAGDLFPDILLMDITLKGNIDGIETARMLKQSLGIPFIFITHSSDDPTIHRAKEVNPYGYIIKPVDKKELMAAIEMSLYRHEMEVLLRDKENRFSTILNSIGDAVIVIDPDDIITYVNPVALDLLEYSESEVLGKHLQRIVQIENVAVRKIGQRETFSSIDDPKLNYLITKNNRRIPIEYQISPQMDEAKNLIGSVLVLRDITDRMMNETILRENYNQMKKTMSGIIQVIAQTVEKRDPYTAGHQRRVADLSRQIGYEMNLARNVIEGIRMAGLIHDLGKISVPAEILSKPGKMSQIELNLIKSHSETGYDILKSIDFPWPVADIVYQHHERLDGSGYPRGIKGDDILLEARIIAVADVVEAMASHRPYRAALGIDEALAEIIKNSGKIYDSEVVDACVNIFRVKKYKMEYLGSNPIIFF